MTYQFSVRGSHKRYVCRTIIRPTQWIAEANYIRNLWKDMVNVHMWASHHIGWPLMVFVDLWVVLFYGWQIKVFYDSDEDDWWKGKGRRLKRWLKRKLTIKIRVPMPVPTARGAK